MHLQQLEGVSFVTRRYTKRVPFLLKMVCKGIRGWGGGSGKVGGPSSYNTLPSAPLAHLGYHYVPQREAVCSFAACYCHILCFFSFFRIQLECIHCPCIKVFCPLFHLHKFAYYSRDTSHVSVRPIKTFTINRGGSSFPVRWWNLSNFVQNLQTSSCFYKSGNHGVTKSSHQVFNYVAVTKS